MHIKLTCQVCGEQLEAVAGFDSEGAIDFIITPCQSFECTEEEKDLYPELEPLMMPYATLVRILKGKEVTVTYRKMNSDIRELTGFLGELDSRSSGNLVYFHELVFEGRTASHVKCLIIERIISIDHYEDGVHTSYTVLEAK